MCKRLLAAALVTVFVCAPASAHELTIHPYIQLLSPTGAWILWETDGGNESLVHFGTTEQLGQMATGSAQTTFGQARVHEVELPDLEPDTTYYYQVTTGDAVSEVHHFRTPKTAGAEASLRIVAMSDMQQDFRNQDVFEDLVAEGVLDFLLPRYGTDLAEVLDMVLVPGDLVDNGLFLNQWRDTFFGPIATVSRHVPVYPVPGNHEFDSDFFFKLFHLPENGSESNLEHWWYHDVSNLRVIGLDSNGRYQTQGQLDWLDDVLDDACDRPELDFVFAQLHHPFKSELWLPGEVDFTGDVVARMESFTARCGKPSIHFFGHTHGYSRGQSRDHQHLWVNVATAGGNIDYWGEYEQRDYDEFTVTQDEYGFVVLDVTAGDDPTLRLRRIGRGDEDNPVQNELRDEIELRLHNTPPAVPVPIHPVGDGHNPDCIVFSASPFEDEDEDLHGATRWQVARSCDDFSQPLIDRWRQHENWFDEVNRSAEDDLEDELVEGLDAGQPFCWRVRYRDRSLAWSAWSEPQPFQTGDSTLSGNLLHNGDAELGTEGWTEVDGFFESVEDGECDSVAPYDGNRLFIVGGNCESAEYAEAFQAVDVSMWADEIDGGAVVVAEAWMRDFNGSDEPAMFLRYLDADEGLLGESDTVRVREGRWTRRQISGPAPLGTRRVDVVLTGTRNRGNDNDSYFDAISLAISGGEQACDTFVDPDPDPDPDPDVGPDADMDVGPDVEDTTPQDVGEDADADEMDAIEEIGPEPRPDVPEPDVERDTNDARDVGDEDVVPDAEADAAAPDADEPDGDGVSDTGPADTGEDANVGPVVETQPVDDGCGCEVERRAGWLWSLRRR